MSINLDFSSFDFRLALLVFVAYIFIDGMYAYYTLQVTKLKPYSAATVGALMHFLLALGVLSYVQNILYLLPLVLGSWLGTFFVVRREQRKS